MIKELENDQRQGLKKDNTWSAIPSLEGGTATIGYGHKLSEREQRTGMISYNGEVYSINAVPNDVVEGLLQEDIAKAEQEARNVIASKAGYDGWSRMSKTNKLLATELAFNVGPENFKEYTEFMRLATSTNPEDQKKAFSEIGRSYKDPKTNKKVPLSNRVQKIIDSVS